MYIRSLFLLLAVASPLAAQSVLDQRHRDLSQLDAGIVCAPPVIDERPAPGSITGTTGVFADAPEFVSRGRQVPAVIGVAFGLSVTAKGRNFAPLDVSITHPPMGANGVTEQSFVTDLIDGVSRSSLYAFEDEWELVEGPWTITATYLDELVYHLNFEVVDPRLLPELASICGYVELFS